MSIVEEINDRLSMQEVLEYYGVVPKRSRNNYVCLWHDDHKPSAAITRDGKKIHCYSCGIHKSMLDVISHFENCDFKTAVKIADKVFNLGILRELSHREKLEIARLSRERELARKRKEDLEHFEEETKRKLGEHLRFWEKIQTATHLTRGEYRSGNWQFGELFMYALERQHWYGWIYDIICELDHEECVYDYIYGTNKQKLLERLQKREIII